MLALMASFRGNLNSWYQSVRSFWILLQEMVTNMVTNITLTLQDAD